MLLIFVVSIVFIRLEKKKESLEKVCEKKDFYVVVMPSENTHMLKFNQDQKSEKTPSFIYGNLKLLIKRIDECKDRMRM